MANNDSEIYKGSSWFPNDVLESDIELQPVRILVAEDDVATRTLLTKTLNSKGYNITAVADGREAWEVLEDMDNPPSLAIIDWMIPGLDGIDLCKRIKARNHPFVYTILLTAKSQNADIVEGLKAGAHEFLTKPFDINVLGARVEAGARIVRLEKALSRKNSIIMDYVDKLEKKIWERDSS